MTEDNKPRRASTLTIVFSAAITLYFLYVLIFGNGLDQPFLLIFLYVLAVIANLVFLISLVLRRK
jgi:hypothetical protein